MKRLLHLLFLPLMLLAVACEQQSPASSLSEIRTVENAALQALPVEPAKVLREEATELKPPEPDSKDLRAGASPSSSSDDEAEPPVELPFAPLIAMDPVDGSKVSIRVGTPVAEYKDKLYYFSSEANKKAFLASPEENLKGGLARY